MTSGRGRSRTRRDGSTITSKSAGTAKGKPSADDNNVDQFATIDRVPTVHDYHSDCSDDEWLEERTKASRYSVVEANRTKSLIVMSEDDEDDQEAEQDIISKTKYADENFQEDNAVKSKDKGTRDKYDPPIIEKTRYATKDKKRLPSAIDRLWSHSTESGSMNQKAALLRSNNNVNNNATAVGNRKKSVDKPSSRKEALEDEIYESPKHKSKNQHQRVVDSTSRTTDSSVPELKTKPTDEISRDFEASVASSLTDPLDNMLLHAAVQSISQIKRDKAEQKLHSLKNKMENENDREEKINNSQHDRKQRSRSKSQSKDSKGNMDPPGIRSVSKTKKSKSPLKDRSSTPTKRFQREIDDPSKSTSKSPSRSRHSTRSSKVGASLSSSKRTGTSQERGRHRSKTPSSSQRYAVDNETETTHSTSRRPRGKVEESPISKRSSSRSSRNIPICPSNAATTKHRNKIPQTSRHRDDSVSKSQDVYNKKDAEETILSSLSSTKYGTKSTYERSRSTNRSNSRSKSKDSRRKSTSRSSHKRRDVSPLLSEPVKGRSSSRSRSKSRRSARSSSRSDQSLSHKRHSRSHSRHSRSHSRHSRSHSRHSRSRRRHSNSRHSNGQRSHSQRSHSRRRNSLTDHASSLGLNHSTHSRRSSSRGNARSTSRRSSRSASRRSSKSASRRDSIDRRASTPHHVKKSHGDPSVKKYKKKTDKKKKFKGSKYISDHDVKDEAVERARFEVTKEMIELLEEVQKEGPEKILQKKSKASRKSLGPELTTALVKKSVFTKKRKDFFKNFSTFFKMRKKDEVVLVSATPSEEPIENESDDEDDSSNDENMVVETRRSRKRIVSRQNARNRSKGASTNDLDDSNDDSHADNEDDQVDDVEIFDDEVGTEVDIVDVKRESIAPHSSASEQVNEKIVEQEETLQLDVDEDAETKKQISNVKDVKDDKKALAAVKQKAADMMASKKAESKANANADADAGPSVVDAQKDFADEEANDRKSWRLATSKKMKQMKKGALEKKKLIAEKTMNESSIASMTDATKAINEGKKDELDKEKPDIKTEKKSKKEKEVKRHAVSEDQALNEESKGGGKGSKEEKNKTTVDTSTVTRETRTVKQQKATFTQANPAEIDEYSIGELVQDEPGVVQCLRFYSCNPAANVLNVAIKVTDVCNDPNAEMDEYTSIPHRIRDPILASRKSKDDDSILATGSRLESITGSRRGYSPLRHMPTVEVVLEDEGSRSYKSSLYRFVDKNNKTHPDNTNTAIEDEDPDDFELEEAPELAMRNVKSFVLDVSGHTLHLDEDSVQRRTREAIKRGIASADERSVLSITSIRVPASVVKASNRSSQDPDDGDEDYDDDDDDDDDGKYNDREEYEDERLVDEERSEVISSAASNCSYDSESSGIVDEGVHLHEIEHRKMVKNERNIAGKTSKMNRVQRILSRFRRHHANDESTAAHE